MMNMSMSSKLSLVNCWSNPSLHITYLDEGSIYAEFRNNSDDTIEIDKIICQFQTEEGLKPYQCFATQRISIKPRNISKIQIPFVADLSLTADTNSYSLVVECRYAGNSDMITLNPPTYLIIQPVRPPEKHFFVSHKDPEDTQLASKLNNYLMKIGFKGYLAEKERRPGLDIWQEKIMPAIDECVALIVLWTSNASVNPKNILREFDYAKDCAKKPILLVEQGVDLPDSFPQDFIEYVRTPGKVTEVDLIDLVRSIEHVYTTGGY